MTGHEANLARVQALRAMAFTWKGADVGNPLLDHVEDVLTRHAPRTDGWDVCGFCEARGGGTPCPDYDSALTLLDALDGGAK